MECLTTTRAYANNLNQDHINLKVSSGWLSNEGLFPETKGFLISIPDHLVPTLNYWGFITKELLVETIGAV